MLLCKFCNKECKSDRSRSSHQTLCKKNPDHKNPADWATGHRKGVTSWNAGLVGDHRLKHSAETKKLLSELNLKRSPEWNKENGKRISKVVNEKVANGEWHTSLAKHMHIDYNGVDLHGSWELKYAQYLDSNNIAWIRNKEVFNYEFEGKTRRYTPDFYLPETDEYVEVKGYKTEKDAAKWAQFPKHRKLVVLMKNELKAMKILLFAVRYSNGKRLAC